MSAGGHPLTPWRLGTAWPGSLPWLRWLARQLGGVQSAPNGSGIPNLLLAEHQQGVQTKNGHTGTVDHPGMENQKTPSLAFGR